MNTYKIYKYNELKKANISTTNCKELVEPILQEIEKDINWKSDKLGTNLKQRLKNEIFKYKKAKKTKKGFEYGNYFLAEDILYHIPSKIIYEISLVNRTDLIHSDKTLEIQRRKFRKFLPLVVGLSVGSNIFHSINQLMRPDRAIIIDPDIWSLSNFNRVDATIDEIGLKKAESIYKKSITAYPYQEIAMYTNKLTQSNLTKIFNSFKKHKPTIIIDEIDDLLMKIYIRKFARKNNIPVFMASDVGEVVQIDFIPNLKKEDLIPGIKDKTLERMLKEYQKTNDPKIKMELVKAILGDAAIEKTINFTKIINREIKGITTSLCQSGATAKRAGAHSGQLLSQWVLDEGELSKAKSHKRLIMV